MMTMSLMRAWLAFVLVALTVMVSSGVAHAQTAPVPPPQTAPVPPPQTMPRGYVEAVAQSSFGEVTSQSYGGEAGVTVWRNLQVFVELGQIRNVAPAALGANAQQIAAFLAQTQTGVSVSVRQPASFGAAGLK